jgi:flagellar hook-associated protein 2
VYAPNSDGGLGSGINVSNIVNGIIQADSTPLTLLQNQETTLDNQSSALATLNSDLSNLQTAVNALNDYNGALDALTATSSDDSVLTATAGSGATTGTHTVVVNNLATNSTYYTSEFSSSSATLPVTGSIQLQVGNGTVQTIPVDSGDNTNTLSGLASYINNLNMGVTANVITDANGARLALVSNTSGKPGDLTITDNTGANNDGLGFTAAVDANDNALGANASLTVDGIPISSSSNTVTGAIPGVTLSLASAAPDSTITLSVSPDTTQATTAINNFVSSYNQLVNDMNSQLTISSSGSAAPLLGDPSLQVVQQTILQDATYSLSGNSGITSLASLGISMNDDGTLTVDSGTLSNALNSNFAAIQNFFQSITPSGFAANLANDLNSLTNPATGPLNAESNGITQQIDDLNTQISDFQANLKQTQQQLTDQYSTINATLEELPMLMDQLNTQLSSLNPSTTV